MEEPKTAEDRPSKFRIYLIVMAVSTLNLSTGAVTGWSSPILPKLNLTSFEQGLVTSLYSFGAAPGPFITTFCLDTIGRKGTLSVIWFFYLASWIILLISQNVYVIYFARIIGGLGVGGALNGIPVYVTEVAIPEIRGPLGAASTLMIGLGALAMYWVGPYVTYTTISIYGIATATLFAVVFFFVPESPFHHIRKGRGKEAEVAIQKLRGYRTRTKLEEELEEIKKTVIRNEQNAVGWLEGMKHPAASRSIGLGLFLTTMTLSTGLMVQGAYAQTIFSSYELSFPASYIGMINVVCSILFKFLPIWMVNKCVGMKTSIILSGFTSGLTCVVLGIYFYLIRAGYDLYNYSYLAIVLTVANTLAHSIGLGTLVWTMVAELLPMCLKGIGTGIVGCVNSLLGFGLLQIFPVIASSYGYSTNFFGLAIIMFILSAMGIFILPDTTGKTVQELEELFM
nr:sugar transporter ERD6-like 6 isoform X2 [Halyomorpha halys]